jgi:hypothetical protein
MLAAVAIWATADCLNAWVNLRRFFLGTLVRLTVQCVLFQCLSAGVHAKTFSIGVHRRSSAVEILSCPGSISPRTDRKKVNRRCTPMNADGARWNAGTLQCVS